MHITFFLPSSSRFPQGAGFSFPKFDFLNIIPKFSPGVFGRNTKKFDFLNNLPLFTPSYTSLHIKNTLKYTKNRTNRTIN